jgi:hypothetical protein
MERKNKYFIYTILCTKTDQSYFGMSNSENHKYNPINFFIEKYKSDGNYRLLNESINEHGKKYHTFVRVDLPNFRNLSIENAEILKHKLIQNCMDLSLNDSNVLPVRILCRCGYNILESYLDKHICPKDISDKVNARLALFEE